ncbi:MAG TPA: hypothetical protein VGC79_36010, partial [Polyangiaceae bacterium]
MTFGTEEKVAIGEPPLMRIVGPAERERKRRARSAEQGAAIGLRFQREPAPKDVPPRARTSQHVARVSVDVVDDQLIALVDNERSALVDTGCLLGTFGDEAIDSRLEIEQVNVFHRAFAGNDAVEEKTVVSDQRNFSNWPLEFSSRPVGPTDFELVSLRTCLGDSGSHQHRRIVQRGHEPRGRQHDLKRAANEVDDLGG